MMREVGERETCSQSRLTVTFHSPISVHVVCMCVSKCVCVHVSAHAVEAWGWYWMSSSITLYRICWGPVSHLNLDFTNMVNLACPLFLGVPCRCLENWLTGGAGHTYLGHGNHPHTWGQGFYPLSHLPRPDSVFLTDNLRYGISAMSDSRNKLQTATMVF